MVRLSAVCAGAINNAVLCHHDPNGKLVPKDNLQAANLARKGHYRIIREETWDALVKFYEGSGPKILLVSRGGTLGAAIAWGGGGVG